MNGADRLTASEAAARLAAGTLTAEMLVRDCLDRASGRAEVKAWAWLDPEQALAQARRADRAGRPGPSPNCKRPHSRRGLSGREPDIASSSQNPSILLEYCTIPATLGIV